LFTVIYRSFWLVAVLAGFVGTGQLALSQRQRLDVGPIAIESVNEVIQAWSVERHLFIKGEIGVGTQQLVVLQHWLAANGPHWTIVLLQSASGESFQASDGRTYSDMDAVEHALGYGLSNRTGFGALEHSTTKEKDGAIFVLFLRERKFSYFASDAQDRRGLGQSHWIGELDQPAFRAMRSGGRIIDAVKDTVQSINRRLDNAIQAEASAARRAADEQKRGIEFLKAGIETTRTSIQDVEKNAQDILAAHPSATGPLTQPTIKQWRSALEEIESQLTPEFTRANEQSLAKVADEIARFLNAFASAGDLTEQSAKLESRILALNKDPNGIANPFIEQTRKILSEAKLKADDGQLDVASLIAQAEVRLSQANNAIEQENQRIAEVNQKIEQARLLRMWVLRTVYAMLGILAAILASFLGYLNRQRRPAMVEAKKMFLEREQSVRKETDHIDQLFQRNREIIGSREKIDDRGYTGRTRIVSEAALESVDDLFVMSKEVNRVMEEARDWISPKNIFGKLINLISSFRYQRGVNHLSGTPLRFSKRGGLPWVLRDQIAAAADQGETGKGETGKGETGKGQTRSDAELPDEIAMTFEAVFQAFKQRGVEAQASLTTIEDSLSTVHESLQQLHEKLEEATQRELRLTFAAKQDGYFGIPKFVEILLPSIQEDLASADQLSTFDAVQACEGPIPNAARKLTEADQLSNELEATRRDIFPKLRQTAEELKGFGYASNWIDSALTAIAHRADQLIELAAKQSVATEIKEVSEVIENLNNNALSCVELAKAIQTEHRPSLSTLEENIRKARADLGQAMQLPSESMLRELDCDPDDSLAQARDNVEAAKTMLVQGRFEAAAAAIDTMRSELNRADAILRESKTAVESFNKVRLSNSQSLENLRARSSQLSQAVVRAKQAYAAAALVIHYSEVVSPQISMPSRGKLAAEISKQEPAEESSKPFDILPGARPADDLIDETVSAAQEIQRLLDLSDGEHRQGSVLKSANQLEEADLKLMRAHGMLQYVTEHLEKLEMQSRENVSVQERCEALLRRLEKEVEDPTVSGKTLAALEQVSASIRMNRQELDTANVAANPFESGKVIGSAMARLEEMQSRIIADRQGYAEAGRAVSGAERQLEVARQFIQQSQSDGISDSPLTVQLNQRITQQSQQLASIRQALRASHGDWESVDDQASQLHSDISQASEKLSNELQVASQALQAFQQASQNVFKAEQWSGAWGSRVLGSPGVSDLERARVGLQSGNYQTVLELSRIAASAALSAIMQAEREIARRRMEESRAAEMARRAREAARRPKSSSRDFGGGISDFFGSGGFGGGGGFGGSSSSSRSSSSSSGSSSSSSGGNSSGFSRSGW